MTIDFNPDGKKTILTIDGGGARGLIPLKILCRLEDETGKTSPELFDFVGGTSVGALIAAGIAAGHSAKDLIGVYERFVQDIFHKDYLAIVFRHGLRYLYDKTALRDLLRHYVGDVRLADLDTHILLTVKDMARSETIFFVNAGPGAAATQHASLARVAEASASAPLYFQPVGDAVDGGVGTYGSPCYVATVEAMEYLCQEDDGWRDGNVIHCAVGTGRSVNRLARGEARRWWPWQWPLWFLGEFLQEATDDNVRFTMRHYDDRIDFRRYQVSLLDEIVRDELGVTIPDGFRSNALWLDSADPRQIALLRDIGDSFAAGIDFTLTGKQLVDAPPPGYGGVRYPSRLAALTPAEVDRMLGDT